MQRMVVGVLRYQFGCKWAELDAVFQHLEGQGKNISRQQLLDIAQTNDRIEMWDDDIIHIRGLPKQDAAKEYEGWDDKRSGQPGKSANKIPAEQKKVEAAKRDEARKVVEAGKADEAVEAGKAGEGSKAGKAGEAADAAAWELCSST